MVLNTALDRSLSVFKTRAHENNPLDSWNISGIPAPPDNENEAERRRRNATERFISETPHVFDFLSEFEITWPLQAVRYRIGFSRTYEFNMMLYSSV